ncbi:peptidase inhibitor family I36 protein [Sanguibacter massiliensis]|uniref:peptidase inhibitor family I36 protein n=1 Tax=Sanguibacter massiliensis TaxID=1973217 RepID=UPI0013EA8677|nr:peptidase inhibitor family I36 protein [Sanguibacter massiliensis]
MIGLVVAATPGVAGAGNPDYCASGRICVYKNWNFDGGLGWRGTSFSLTNLSTSAEDQVSSWENRRSDNGRWYKGRNGTGTCYTMSAKRENAKMNVFTQSDTMSSWAGNGAC